MLNVMLGNDAVETPARSGARPFSPDRAWWEMVLRTVDSGDAARFVSVLTPDARFRFGNAPVIAGVDAISSAVAGFFSAIASSRHTLTNCWGSQPLAACEGEVTYTRHDGSVVTFPFVNVFELRGEKISAYRIYIDNGPLFGPSA